MTKPNSSPVPPAKGTRDLYPDQMLRQNYITKLWRDTAIRHGFEEINGPTFEMLELYTRKSGEGIVSELFRFRREGGDDDYALRPEFTPTLARMYAAKAASLPSPTKWFSIGPYFRAEKPQRGRLREFLQWNVDVLGVESAASDAELVSLLADALGHFGLRSRTSLGMSNRQEMLQLLRLAGLHDDANIDQAFQILDQRSKVDEESLSDALKTMGVRLATLDNAIRLMKQAVLDGADESRFTVKRNQTTIDAVSGKESSLQTERADRIDLKPFAKVFDELRGRGLAEWAEPDFGLVRGLAYYTGTVFEVIAEGERAIAGGGRYDNLIELFGGPPTPAVGFGMGDVVLGLLLDDKGLMPRGKELMDALSQPAASLRPEAFVFAGSEDEDELIEPLLASLRRGIETDGFDGKPWSSHRYTVRPMHARRTYKTTRNLKKLLADAEKQHARFAIVLHGPDKVQVKDLDTREELVHERGDFSVDPQSDAYVGTAIAQRLA
ncbi:MAG: ATP phosphoribosyltransferase regulatory subunit [Planctomycetota bacterium]